MWNPFWTLSPWATWAIVTYTHLSDPIIANYACNSGQMNSVKTGNIQLYCPYGTMREIVDVIQTHQNDNVMCSKGGLTIKNYRALPSTCHYNGMNATTKAVIDKMF